MAGSLDKTSRKSAEEAVKRAAAAGTTLVIKENGKIKELTPRQMQKRLSKI